MRQVQDQVELAEAGAAGRRIDRDRLEDLPDEGPGHASRERHHRHGHVDSASPLALYAQSTAPLQGARVATISFAAKSPTLPEVPAWLNALATLPGFADATPGSVTLDATTNVYTVNITMHVNDAAFDNRFDPKEK